MAFSIRSSAASFACLAIALTLPATAHAQTQRFDVPAQAASSGVRLFAKQAGIQVIVSSQAAQGRRVNIVTGMLDVRTALDRLLAGTGLIVQSFDGRIAILVAQAPDPADTAEMDSPELLVTGSRISRPEVESAMPVSVVRSEQIERLGVVTPYDALVREPAIAPGVGPQNSQFTIDAGIASVSLRNMGVNRTLTLIDGRRRVSGSGRSSAVDLNMIAVGSIDRIEVVTGGAAAIYGADAVTGAVNVITKKNVDGFELSTTQGISEQGDAYNFTISALGGGTFADGRGSMSIGGTYMKSKGLDTYDRDYAARRLNYVANPANTGANDGIPDRIIAYDFGEFYYQFYPTFVLNNVNYGYQNGAVRPLYVKTPLGNRGEFYGGDGGGVSDIRNVNEGLPLRTPLEQFAITSRFNYDLTDDIESISQFDYGRTRFDSILVYFREDSRSVYLNGQGSQQGSPWAYLDNPYLPDSIRQMMVDNGLTRLRISRAYKEWGVFNTSEEREAFTFSQTLNGRLAGDLKWEGFYQYGRTRSDMEYKDILRASRWLAARDVITDPVTGLPACRDAVARAQGCVPYNIFNTDAPTAEQRKWLFETRRAKRENTQQIFGASIVGSAFALPAGDVSIAIGAEHRRETLETSDDPLALAGDLVYTNFGAKQPRIDASFKVSEFYGELVAPILRDLPFAYRLEIEGAYRHSDYSTIGRTDAWKIGATWSPLPGLTLRGVRSRSVRAPNFGELFEPNTTTQANLSDPCEDSFYFANPNRTANCRALGLQSPPPNSLGLSTVTGGGNPDLRPETSNSLTLGAIFQPRFLRGLDIAVDYWRIDIDDVITTFGANTILNYCVDLPTLDNPFCGQITRDPNDPVRSVTAISTQTINASRLEARGIDFSLGYRTEFLNGQLSADLKGTYLLKKETQAVPGIPASIVRDMGRYTDPRFRASMYLNYARERWEITLGGRLQGAGIVDPNAISDEYNDDDRIPAIFYGDFSVSFKPTDKLRLSFGVNNLFDVEPPYNPSTYTGANGYYDVVGRRYFVSAKTKL